MQCGIDLAAVRIAGPAQVARSGVGAPVVILRVDNVGIGNEAHSRLVHVRVVDGQVVVVQQVVAQHNAGRADRERAAAVQEARIVVLQNIATDVDRVAIDQIDAYRAVGNGRVDDVDICGRVACHQNARAEGNRAEVADIDTVDRRVGHAIQFDHRAGHRREAGSAADVDSVHADHFDRVHRAGEVIVDNVAAVILVHDHAARRRTREIGI